MSKTKTVINSPQIEIEKHILLIRGEKVLLDVDLAELYSVKTGDLTRSVRRNIDRFPADFMFQLTNQEFIHLKCHSGISRQWGGRRYPPYAFTEHGIAMLSSVLHSKRAIQVNIEIMRTFVRLRRMLADNDQLARKLTSLERKYDKQFKIVFDAIRELMRPVENKRRKPIGFIWSDNQ